VVDFEPWYEREHGRVATSVYLLFGSLDLAKDATDEAFARALANWDRVAGMASPGGWVTTVAVNVARRAMRRAQHEARLAASHASEPYMTPPLPNPHLWAAVAALSDRQRTAVVLRYVADLTEPEIAKVMHIPRGTVAATLSRARTTLGMALERD
jgi:RNA polymerase sigma-70 factor (ECF subfamily)